MSNYDLVLNLSTAVVAAVVMAVVVKVLLGLLLSREGRKVVFVAVSFVAVAWLMIGIVIETMKNGNTTTSGIMLLVVAVVIWFVAFGFDQLVLLVQERRRR